MHWPANSIHPGTSLLAVLLFLGLLSACGGSRDETVAGATLPVPSAMKKSADKPVEIAIFGFGGGQASFHGDMESAKLVEFYKKELPARGWQESMNLVSGGAVLAYSKDGKTVLIGISKDDKGSVLSLTVGGVGK